MIHTTDSNNFECTGGALTQDILATSSNTVHSRCRSSCQEFFLQHTQLEVEHLMLILEEQVITLEQLWISSLVAFSEAKYNAQDGTPYSFTCSKQKA